MLVEEKLIDQEIIDTCLIPLGDARGEVLDAYLSQMDEVVKKIILALDKNDLTSIAKEAHSLKGASLQLGFHQIGTLARDIEDIAKGNEIYNEPNYPQLKLQLKLSYEATVSYIRKELL